MGEKRTMRKGKTRKDHETGAWNNRFANRAAREAWQKDKGAKFPVDVCNGKRNRLKG